MECKHIYIPYIVIDVSTTGEYNKCIKCGEEAFISETFQAFNERRRKTYMKLNRLFKGIVDYG